MVDKHRLARMLIQHESMELKPYRCSEGKLTIGVGRNIEDRGISEKEAMFMLDNDIDDSIQALKHFSWFNDLSDVRQEVLVNLHFNIGHGSFLGFKKMIWNLEKGDYFQAAEEMKDSRWYNQVGIRAKRLIDAMKNDHF